MKYTPGPWKFSTTHDNNIENSFGYAICEWYTNEESEKEDISNARLIKSAPKMYEALKKALKLSPMQDFNKLDPGLMEDAVILEILAVVQEVEGV